MTKTTGKYVCNRPKSKHFYVNRGTRQPMEEQTTEELPAVGKKESKMKGACEVVVKQ